MANYINTFKDAVTACLETYRAQTQEDALLNQAYSRLLRTDYNRQSPEIQEQLMREAKETVKEEHYKTAVSQIEQAQASLREAAQADALKIEREKLRMLTGLDLVDEYAKVHKLESNQAERELEAYARIKQKGYSDSVMDKYAMLRNRSSLEGDDAIKAAQYEKEETARRGIAEIAANVKSANYYTSETPGGLISSWNTTGAVLLRKLEAQRAGNAAK